VDAQLFGSRASAEVTLYEKTVDDLILVANIAPSSGFPSQVVNGGQLRNRGAEVSVGVTPIQSARATWVSRITYASGNNVLTKLPIEAYNAGGFGTGYGQIRIEEGKSITSIIARNGYDSTFTEGGQFVSRAVREEIIGDAKPKFEYGFSNDLTFGRVRLYGLLNWRHGQKVANLTQNFFDGSGTAADQTDGGQTNAEMDENIARAVRTNDYSTLSGAERLRAHGSAWRRTAVYIEDGSFVKLRELSVGYAIPDALAGRVFRGATGARVELVGRNLHTWTKYRGLDPEVSNFGNQNLANFYDVAPYPPSRSYFLSVGVNF